MCGKTCMSGIWTVAKREARSYFNSPMAYIVLCAYLLIVGYLFFNTVFLNGLASMRDFFGLSSLLLVIFVPAISMRLIAEEKKSGTIEALLTLPLSELAVVKGKFLAGCFVMVIGFLFTVPYAISISAFVAPGASFDWGPVAGGYLGLVLLCASFMSMGLLASALTKNQIVAFIIALLFCFFFYFIDKLAVFSPAYLAGVLEYISADYHFRSIARGVIDSRDLVYYISLNAIFLMLSLRAIRVGR